jgi:hypothetical protein
MAAINAFKTHRRNSISRWQRRFFHGFSRPWHVFGCGFAALHTLKSKTL